MKILETIESGKISVNTLLILRESIGDHASIRLAIVLLYAGIKDLAGAPLTVAGLADELNIKMATVSRDLGRLAGHTRSEKKIEPDKILVSLEESNADRRYKYIHLTDNGRTIFRKIT